MEFIKHPAVTRIFKPEIDAYQIKSIQIEEDGSFLVIQYDKAPKLSFELWKEIKQAAITAKYEDEAAIDPHEDSDTIQAALLERSKK